VTTPPDNLRLSVIIPTYNRKESLLRTLKALERQTYPMNAFEVLVISDGSSDGTAEAIASLNTAYRLEFVEQSNAGPSRARNNGAQRANALLLVFVDDDIEPVACFLAEHAKAHENDANLVLIAPQSGPFGEPMPAWIEWEHRMLQKQYVNFVSGVWEIGPNNLYSGNFSVSRAALLEVGGFNENFTRQEDVELGFRLEKRGLHFKFSPKADGIHRSSRPFKSWYRTPFEYGRRDVQMSREQEDGGRIMAWARKNYSERNALTKFLAKIAIGVPIMEGLVLALVRGMVFYGGRKVALLACSLLFNLRYLQGMCQELGGRRTLWNTLEGREQPQDAQAS